MNSFNFPPSRKTRLRSYTRGQLCIEQANAAIAWGESQGMGGKPEFLIISTGVGRTIQGFGLATKVV
jgi:hypothetical protein